MKVVLLQDVKNVGKKDELHEVSDGYGRNFLIPRKLAVAADSGEINKVMSKEAARKHHQEEAVAAARAVAESLSGKTFVMRVKGGQSGRLFGSVTLKDIAAELAKQGVEVDKRKLSLDVREIKDFGSYNVEAKIAAGVSAKFTVSVESVEE
ncbi:50S ribosomal protein L9 [Ruminococcaceae bacterium OttesenSCG-928-A11]|nr:50S ribosomal protein L9 [Ruminococcaceae bacterium OttesenSCG-928-A11]